MCKAPTYFAFGTKPIQPSLPITIRTTQKGKAAEETDKGIPLAPSEKDRKPWYSDRNHERSRELDPDKQCVSSLYSKSYYF